MCLCLHTLLILGLTPSSPIGINSQLQKETEHWNACLDMFNTRVQEKLQDIQTYNDELAAICTQCTEQGTVASAFISEQVLTINPVNISMIIESTKKILLIPFDHYPHAIKLNIMGIHDRTTPSFKFIPPYCVEL